MQSKKIYFLLCIAEVPPNLRRKLVQGERNSVGENILMTKINCSYLPNWGAGPNLGATRPRVGIANLGLDAPSWQYLN